MTEAAEEKRVIILLGPTGVGKTGLSILLAQALKTEIISADSMQVYRHMDIGTAKPALGELSAVRHHMIDIADPSGRFSAGRYISEVKPVIERLHGEGRIPLIVGGTGLYIRSLTCGLFAGPEADPDLRARLQDIERDDPDRLYRQLKEIDPKKALSINRSDTRRIIRALEVSIKTERPISELQREHTSPPTYNFIKLGLTRKRDELYRMIEKRVDEMFESGLVNEVKELLKLNPSVTPLQAIGYKEIIDYLNGERDFDETVELIKRSTKRYAKRQFTWFGKEKEVNWVDITGIFDTGVIYRKVINDTKLQGIIDMA